MTDLASNNKRDKYNDGNNLIYNVINLYAVTSVTLKPKQSVTKKVLNLILSIISISRDTYLS